MTESVYYPQVAEALDHSTLASFPVSAANVRESLEVRPGRSFQLLGVTKAANLWVIASDRVLSFTTSLQPPSPWRGPIIAAQLLQRHPPLSYRFIRSKTHR